MASTDVTTSFAGTTKNYAKIYYSEAFFRSPLSLLYDMGCVYEPAEVKNYSGGDACTINTYGRLGGTGFTENSTVEGNEQSQSIGTFTISWNETIQAVRFPSKNNIKQMRLQQDLKRIAYGQIGDWVKNMITRQLYIQAAGVTSTSLTYDAATFASAGQLALIRGHNNPTAPTSTRIIRPAGISADESLTSSHTITLDLIDDIVAQVRSSYPAFTTCEVGGFDAVGVIHPLVMNDLKQDTAGSTQLFPITLAQIQGGNADAGQLVNSLGFNGGFVYNNCLLLVDARVPNGVNSSTGAQVANTYRNVFFGRNAIVAASPFNIAPTTEDDEVPLIYAEETFEYSRFEGVAGITASGFKKFVGQEGVDNNTFVISVYSA